MSMPSLSMSKKSLRSPLAVGLLGLLLAFAAPLTANACTAITAAQRATEIADGHSFTKHRSEFVKGTVINGLAFPHDTIDDATEFATFILAIMTSGAPKALSNNRIAYWDGTTGTVVIFNPNAGDCGTTFRPDKGKKYYDDLT